MSEKKSVSMMGILLVAVSSILVIDTVAASAIIGPSAIGWWVLFFFVFFLPYGLVTAELGTTYKDEGAIVDWVNRAFGRGSAARVSWLYWVNYSLWVPAVYYMFAIIAAQLMGLELGPFAIAIFATAMTWLTSYIATFDVERLTWIASLGAIFKSVIMVILGVGGLYVGFTNGFANPFTIWDTLPSFGDGGTYLPIIIFNVMGFEIIAGAASTFKDPERDIPKATVLGGILITFFYLLASLGILAVIPLAEISDSSGVIDAFQLVFGTSGGAQILVYVIGVMVLYTLVSNVVTWAMGVNQTVVYAAQQGLMPKMFEGVSEKTGMPTTASWANAWMGTATMVAYLVMVDRTGNEDLFWNVFSLGAIGLLASYVMMFPAFLKLRLTDKEAVRGYTIPGGTPVAVFCSVVPTLILLGGLVFFFWVPGSPMDMEYFYTVGAGLLIAVIGGEFLIAKANREHRARTDQKSVAAE
ncbi:agmatine:putrescine antiporter (APC superfamily) [Shimia isoporae]|uniref:Agmatine:putrescine antiporter (APC superfamily) n=1 Tax=Shimia isoporae TaxID=647720 RepID=A0A4R1NAU4_9RHOB|nr:APC family permease [Shimia isoporae]TCL01229.1 agmatine:putrescine antiporter (APC superfamily) [Shimia isoporae]